MAKESYANTVVDDRTQEIRPFGIKDKLGYMAGDIANDMFFIFASSFLMVFYTNVLGISGAAVGTLFLVSRIVDAFTDVGMGRIVDTFKPAKDGRFRPWIRRVAPFAVIAGFLMFLYVVKDWPMPAKMIYVYVTYIFWGSFCYTGINIPYGSMASVISDKAEDRAALSTFRSVGASIASMVISFVVPLVVYTTNSSGDQVIVPERFTMIAFVFGIVALVMYGILYFWSVERIQLPEKDASSTETVGQQMKSIVVGLTTNRALLGIISAAIFLLLAQILVGTMNAYLYTTYFNSASGLAAAGILGTVGVLVLAPFASKIAARFGKKESGTVALLISATMYGLIFFLQINNVWAFLAFAFVGNLGMNYFNIIIWAFISDIIDYQEVRTGKREDGTIYAVYSFSRKIGQAFAGGLGGFALSAVGFVSGASAQTPEVATNIYRIATGVPAIAYVIVALSLAFIYPLSKKRVEENTRILKERRAAAQ